MSHDHTIHVTLQDPPVIVVTPADPPVIVVTPESGADISVAPVAPPVINLNPQTAPTITVTSAGPSGASAYQIWLNEGNVGTEQDFLDSLQGSSVLTWADYAVQPSVEIATIAAGTVRAYTKNAVTVFRLIPNPYDAAQDAFYSAFDGTNLTGLLDTKG